MGEAQPRRDYEADAKADRVHDHPIPVRQPLRPNEHPCPACGTPIPNAQLACKPDWFRLPKPLRDEVGLAYRKRLAPGGRVRHINAMRAAYAWYFAEAKKAD